FLSMSLVHSNAVVHACCGVFEFNGFYFVLDVQGSFGNSWPVLSSFLKRTCKGFAGLSLVRSGLIYLRRFR
ncbi:13419_t:CDS:2, partial [Gigaspora rosea]